MAGATQDQVGNQRNTQTFGDQSHDGDVVLGLERDVGLEPGRAAYLQEVATATRTAGDPGLVVEQGQVGDFGTGHRVVLGQCEPNLVVEQLDGDEHVEVLLL